MAKPIHFLDAGNREGTPLLLVHGDFSAGVGAWRRQIEALGDACRLIVVDRRGHGDSPLDPRPYTFAQDAQDLADALNRASVARAHVVGHSYGGLAAIQFCASFAERALSLHLIEPPVLAIAGDDPDAAQLAEATHRLWRAAKEMEADELTEAFFAMLIGAEGAAELKAKSAWSSLAQGAPRFRDEAFAGSFPIEVLDRLPPGLPVTIYSGERSHPGLKRVARRIAETLRVPLHVFPEAGHDVQRIGEPFDRALLEAIGKQ